MKEKTRRKSALALTAALALSLLAGCGTPSSDGRGESFVSDSSGAEEQTAYVRVPEMFSSLSEGAADFAFDFSEGAKSIAKEGENFAVSPLSVYMALSLAAECAAGNTKEEILSAMGVSYETLTAEFGDLYRSLNVGFDEGELSLTNSVWVNEGEQVFDERITALKDSYFCPLYTADFISDNENANRAVREFVKEQTNGLIDKDFQLDTETVFALINTLYFKDVWSAYGPIGRTEEEYAFAAADGSTRRSQFLVGGYSLGRMYEGEGFTSFYSETENGYRLHFLLPADGYTAEDIFTAENLKAVSKADYGGTDEENKIRYYTRCIFPEFSASFDGDVKGLLKEGFGVGDFFDRYKCDVTPFIVRPGENVYCERVVHVTQFNVDEEGIEGAAVTVEVGVGDSAPEYEEIYSTLVVNRSFGFFLSDPDGVVLFSGIVRDIS